MQIDLFLEALILRLTARMHGLPGGSQAWRLQEFGTQVRCRGAVCRERNLSIRLVFH